MIIEILIQYHLSFNLIYSQEHESYYTQVSGTNTEKLTKYLVGFFYRINIHDCEELIFPTLDRALNGEPFDPEDTGGDVYYLIVGEETSYISCSESLPIPTQDIRDLLQAWVDWVIENQYEEYAP